MTINCDHHSTNMPLSSRLRHFLRYMSNPKLHIYNPETEYALASASPYYTLPESVRRLRMSKARLPEMYAGHDDAILLMDGADPEPDRPSSCTLLTPDMDIEWSRYIASPWGWNAQIACSLTASCPGLRGIPSAGRIDRLRKLAHRRTTINFLKAYEVQDISLPLELDDYDTAVEFYHKHPNIFLKAPWSSSGRGVMRTDDLKPMHVEPWMRGIIRSQGSVMVEPIYDKALDCATEWTMRNGKAAFLGVSVFEASGRGKYHRNIEAGQLSLWNMIGVLTPEVIEKQRHALQSVIGSDYDGPLGIDMLVTSAGTLHPCVELNLRHTMGSILIHPDDKSLVAKYPAMF